MMSFKVDQVSYNVWDSHVEPKSGALAHTTMSVSVDQDMHNLVMVAQ